MLRQVLSENGFTTTCVMSPTDMEPVLARGNVDLLVLDVMLTGEAGFSICRRLRATSGIPIIILTALGERSEELRVGQIESVRVGLVGRLIINKKHQLTYYVISILCLLLES